METINFKRFFLVSGGSGGIGSAVCMQLASKGFLPIVGYNTNKEIAEKVAIDAGGFALELNLSNHASISNAVNLIQKKLKNGDFLSGVILCASPPPDLFPFSQLSSKHFLDQFEINVLGPKILLTYLIKNFFKKQKKGQVIGVLSNAIGTNKKSAATGMGAYIVGKSSMQSLLSVCIAEYPWLDIATVSPSFTDTKMLKVFDERYIELVAKKEKILDPGDVAGIIMNEIIA